MDQLILHEYAMSGNCYKIRLTAALVGAQLERRQYNIMTGETRTPEFLQQINANGRIPVLQIDARFLPESNAACYWLADGSSLIPTERFEHADMLRWMAWEQYNHEPNVATMRFWRGWVLEENWSELQRLQAPGKMAAGNDALDQMEAHLATRDYMVGDGMTLADICLYAYTHTAAEGGFDLRGRPAILAWLARVAAHPRYIAIDE